MADMTAEDFVEIMKWSFDQQRSDYESLVDMQKSYDNKINSAMWPTESEIPIATAFTMVQNTMADVYPGMFPNMNFIRLIPNERGIGSDVLERAEFAVDVTVKRTVKLQQASLFSLISTLKQGVGYGIIEPHIITPEASRQIIAGNKSTRQMSIGMPKTSIRYRDINTCAIVPYPSGVDFNGPKATEMSFYLDDMPEDEFRELFKTQPAYGEDKALVGDPEEIIKQAKTDGVVNLSGIVDLIEQTAGRRRMYGSQMVNDRIPVRIPILKCYMPRRHVYVVPLAKPVIIYDEKEKYQTLRVPLIKWDAWPDSDKWFGMSAPKADLVRGTAYNVWFNFFFDAMTWMANRNLIYSDDAFNKKRPNMAPNEAYGVKGDDVGKAARWLEPPRIDPAALQFGGEIRQIGDTITGQSDMTQKNFTRGGAMAFQDLLSSAKGRSRMMMSILEMNGLQNSIEQIMVYMKLNAEGDEYYRRPAWDRKAGRQTTEEMRVSSDDINHSFDLMLDLEAKRRYGAIESNDKFGLFDRVIKEPDANRAEAWRILFPDDTLYNRMMKSEEEIERAQLENRVMELRQGQQQGGAPTSIEQQSAQGAGALAV